MAGKANWITGCSVAVPIALLELFLYAVLKLFRFRNQQPAVYN